uniref:NADH-ubiquinone oxidoreductase chain 4L n=1 Tax=Amusium pleuronectes TaxID=158443 RepID=A0A7U0FWC3_9BIVA|nr:NADH dehydrogenase subunit 4L [Amusium pleuronectes]QQV73590.1 NADH dehydrogenase subunit 4L [Amusium pleuronectes]
MVGGLSLVGVFSCTFFIGGWLSFGSQFKHVLSGLLCMEVVLVGVLGAVCSSIPTFSGFLFFYILGLGVCESALGLSLLVIYARSYGNDLFKGLDAQGC